MLAVVFLVLILVIIGIIAVTSPGGTDIPIAPLVAIIFAFAVFFAAGVYVAAALGTLAILGDLIFSTRQINAFFGEAAWRTSTEFVLVAVPLFLLMGNILLQAGLSQRLYRALNLWVGGMPGGLLHTNIFTSAVFSAVTGSSTANAATIGAVALPYFKGTAYPERMVLGSLAGGGALGNLIPPGISFIIYGVFTGTSVGQLYATGFVAGGIATAVFMGYVVIHSLWTHADYGHTRVSWRERFLSMADLVPTGVLIFVVLGLLFLGFMTPTEAAAVGVAGAIIIAMAYRSLTFVMLRQAVRSTARTQAMVGLILIAALTLNFVLGALHLPSQLASAISALPLSPPILVIIILMFYLALGTFMSGFAVMVMTLPVTFPIVMSLGYDPVWFGLMMTIAIEISQISPPDGLVMYVLQGLRDPPGPITDVFMGVIPYLLLYFGLFILFFVWPGLVLWPLGR